MKFLLSLTAVALFSFSVPSIAEEFGGHGGGGHGGIHGGGGFGHGCNPRAVSRASHDLEEAANHFAGVLLSITELSHATRDAQVLAREANHLHRTAHDAAGCGHLRSDFHEVEEAFSHLKRVIRRAHDLHHNPHILSDFREVEQAFAAVNQALYGGGIVVPPSHPTTQTVNILCQSGGYRTVQCLAPGRIVNAVVAVQMSRRRCELGRNVGFSGNVLSVSEGCRANFLVTIVR